MDFAQAKKDIIKWLIDFVELPNASLNGWPPCPYARKARLDNQFEILEGQIDPCTDLMQANLRNKLVIAYVYDRGKFTADEFNTQVDQVNREFLLKRDMIALADHPDDTEEVNGVCMNQGNYAIVFIQSLSKLDQFARIIAAKGYYNGWPDQYLEQLFQHRMDPRK